MTRLLCAAVAAISVTACATTDGGTRPGAMQAAGGAYYCWKDKLYDDGNGMMCNWETSRTQACHATRMVTMERGRLSSEPRNAGRCNNGQWLVEVTTR